MNFNLTHFKLAACLIKAIGYVAAMWLIVHSGLRAVDGPSDMPDLFHFGVAACLHGAFYTLRLSKKRGIAA